jgi:DNA-directed RNA polymerase subunit RPC12/RpoP
MKCKHCGVKIDNRNISTVFADENTIDMTVTCPACGKRWFMFVDCADLEVSE